MNQKLLQVLLSVEIPRKSARTAYARTGDLSGRQAQSPLGEPPAPVPSPPAWPAGAAANQAPSHPARGQTRAPGPFTGVAFPGCRAAQVIPQAHRRVPRQDSGPQLHLSTRPGASGGRCAAGSGGGRAPLGRGRGATPADRTNLVRDPRVAPGGCPCSADSAAAGWPASDPVHCDAAQAGSCEPGGRVWRVRSSQRKGRAPSSSRPPLSERLRARRRAPPPHLHFSRPLHSTTPAHFICISLECPESPPS